MRFFKIIKGRRKRIGRNNQGRITSFRKGGGHKRKIRFLYWGTCYPFFKKRFNVVSKMYDPNRNAVIFLVSDKFFSEFFFILGAQNLSVGSGIFVDFFSFMEYFKAGSFYRLKKIPNGSFIFSVEKIPNTKAVISRSGGSFSQVISKKGNKVLVKFSSGKFNWLDSKCFARFGKVDFIDFSKKVRKKAGRSRWKGIRPTVRGVAINPVDHPHGGGEGKGYIGRPPVSPWGKYV